MQVLAGFGRPLGAFDDCIPLVSATLIDQGRRPVLDYYYIYPPFLDYFYAIVFRILGRTMIVPRIVYSVLYIAVSVLAARFVARRLLFVRPLEPLMVLLASVSLVAVSRLPVWPAYAFSLLAIFGYPEYEKPYSFAAAKRLFFCGLLAGVSIVMRLNFGVYAAAALCVHGTLRLWLSDVPKPRKLRHTATLIGSITFGAALPSVVFYWYMYGSSALSAFAMIVGSTRAALPARFITLSFIETAELLLFPFLWWVVPVLIETNSLSADSLIAGVAGAGMVLLAMAERGSLMLPYIIPALILSCFVGLALWRNRLGPAHLVFALFYTAGLHYYLSRADDAHAAPLFALQGFMLMSLLIPVNFPHAISQSRLSQRGAGFAALLAAICLCGNNDASLPTRDDITRGAGLIANWIKGPRLSDTDRVQGPDNSWKSVLTVHEQEFEDGELDAVKYIASRTKPSESIFVGAQDNSKVYVSDIRFYWLTGRRPGSRYYQLDAGVASTSAVQEKIILDLERNGVAWVILQDQQGEGEPSFRARVHTESRLLDEFLSSHFRKTERFGRFTILKRS
ncbi:MAG: hypothetical protein JO307_12860 [Bryobacterales bacterium]|nr:hypothetical protein [Bryobacterales bacterium]